MSAQLAYLEPRHIEEKPGLIDMILSGVVGAYALGLCGNFDIDLGISCMPSLSAFPLCAM